jgi:hypothetical protein
MARPKTAIVVPTRLSAAAELASPARLGSAGIVFVSASVFRGASGAARMEWKTTNEFAPRGAKKNLKKKERTIF